MTPHTRRIIRTGITVTGRNSINPPASRVVGRAGDPHRTAPALHREPTTLVKVTAALSRATWRDVVLTVLFGAAFAAAVIT